MNFDLGQRPIRFQRDVGELSRSARHLAHRSVVPCRDSPSPRRLNLGKVSQKDCLKVVLLGAVAIAIICKYCV